MKNFIVTLLVLLQCSCTSFISMRNDSVEHFFKPNISKAFIYRNNGDYLLRIVMSDYSQNQNAITKAKLSVNGESIDYILNQTGLISKPFKLSSEQNVNGSIEIETRLGTNNPIVFNKNLSIARSYDADVDRPAIPISNYTYRKALVIGNSKYKVKPLDNPEHDANDIADALRNLGFEVKLKNNLSLKEMKKAVEDFSSEVSKSNEVRLFFYAGHGLEVNRENYLFPIDSGLSNIKDAISLGETLNKIGSYDNVLNIAILDTCRENPFAEIIAHNGEIRSSLVKRSSAAIKNSQSLADKITSYMSSGTIKAFSTAPFKTADDGTGEKNGVYTRFLLKNIKTPNISVETLLKIVSNQVQEETKKKNDLQTPWVESSYIGNFSFTSTK